MKKKIQKEKGITLVSLIIAVIILLVLAGVGLNSVLGENGVINKSIDGVNEYSKKEQKEKVQLEYFNKEFKKILGVSVKEIFDENGKNENDIGYDSNKLHIGDFVNYDAGIWAQDEVDTIKVGMKESEVEVNNDISNLPNKSFQFGGFTVGTSRNDNAKPYKTDYIKEYSKELTGWRVFDVKEDGTVILISAGCPEFYYHPYIRNGAYISEYILSGNKRNVDNLDELYTKRDWIQYINKKQKAIKATALTKANIDEWYTRYWGNVNNEDVFQKNYGTKYESLIDNYTKYWLGAIDMRWRWK